VRDLLKLNFHGIEIDRTVVFSHGIVRIKHASTIKYCFHNNLRQNYSYCKKIWRSFSFLL